MSTIQATVNLASDTFDRNFTSNQTNVDMLPYPEKKGWFMAGVMFGLTKQNVILYERSASELSENDFPHHPG